MLLGHLKKAREDGLITPLNPRKGKYIVESYSKKYKWDLSGRDIRTVVNYLRINKYPIGSEGDGYFWANNHDELEHTENHIRTRIGKMAAALEGLEKAFIENAELFK